MQAHHAALLAPRQTPCYTLTPTHPAHTPPCSRGGGTASRFPRAANPFLYPRPHTPGTLTTLQLREAHRVALPVRRQPFLIP